jgi:uncharacterized glyoxalase superfamily protein PhnB
VSSRRPEFCAAIPCFSVADVGETTRWYQATFGFLIDTFPEDEPYLFALMFREGVEIIVQRIENYQKPDIYHLRSVGVWDAYIRTEGVRELYEAIREKVTIVKPLREQRYGAWEFEVKDPNGYILVFSEFVVKAEDQRLFKSPR